MAMAASGRVGVPDSSNAVIVMDTDATWLLPVLEDGYLDGMHESVGVRGAVPVRPGRRLVLPRHSTPIPSPTLLARVLWPGRGRAVKILYNALIRVSRDPAAADRADLSDLDRQWADCAATGPLSLSQPG